MSTTAELDLDLVMIRLIEMGRGTAAVDVVRDAVLSLVSERGGAGFEMEDLLAHLRRTGESKVAQWFAEAAGELSGELATDRALVLGYQVTPEAPFRPVGAASTGYTDLADLSFQVAHAFEGSSAARAQRYTPLVRTVRSGDRVVDIGCGDGTFLGLAQRRGASGTGVDLDPEKIALCESKGFDVFLGRAQDFDWKARRPDFVSMIHIIEHMTPADALAILDCAVRAMSSSGRLLIVTPNIAHPVVQTNFWLDVTHIRPYPELLLTTFLATLGFPYFQSGSMADGLETWAYGFRRPEDQLVR
jgi:2-polyprenyl-3-methyl-5-hydroxy-6-metoxy-1,4-benzoquinol methylase